MSNLPEFVPNNPSDITRELIASYEAMTGKTLYPAQVERLLIDLISYRESLTRAAINDAARQNLVRFARAPMLDYLGELVGVTRLPAQPAKCQISVVFDAPLQAGLTIPKGARVETGSGVQFELLSSHLIPQGWDSYEMEVAATDWGESGNGYLAGEIAQWVDEPAVSSTVENITITSGGAEQEGGDRLRERIMEAPEAFTTAGSRLAYRHHAMSAHPGIADVAVTTPAPGLVRLHPLMRNGAPPTNAVMAAVLLTCSGEKVRPLTDTVDVAPPTEVPYQLSASITLYHQSDAKQTMKSAQASAEALVQKLRAKLGQDIVPSQHTTALSVPGVYEVQLDSPSTMQAVPDNGIANCTEIKLTLAGVTHG